MLGHCTVLCYAVLWPPVWYRTVHTHLRTKLLLAHVCINNSASFNELKRLQSSSGSHQDFCTMNWYFSREIRFKDPMQQMVLTLPYQYVVTSVHPTTYSGLWSVWVRSCCSLLVAVAIKWALYIVLLVCYDPISMVATYFVTGSDSSHCEVCCTWSSFTLRCPQRGIVLT